jgi:DNA-binding protein HU-beta
MGFGTFSVAERKARAGRNPKTGEVIQIPESKTVKFTASEGLKKGFN